MEDSDRVRNDGEDAENEVDNPTDLVTNCGVCDPLELEQSSKTTAEYF